jgi:hypothetical protein
LTGSLDDNQESRAQQGNTEDYPQSERPAPWCHLHLRRVVSQNLPNSKFDRRGSLATIANPRDF